MKPKKALLAEKLKLEQATQTLQSKAHKSKRTDHTDGTFTVSVPIAATNMKKTAACEAQSS